MAIAECNFCYTAAKYHALITFNDTTGSGTPATATAKMCDTCYRLYRFYHSYDPVSLERWWNSLLEYGQKAVEDSHE